MPGRVKRPTIKDVAREAGVSMMTVLRVLTKKGRASQETIDKVLKTIEDLGYVPEHL